MTTPAVVDARPRAWGRRETAGTVGALLALGGVGLLAYWWTDPTTRVAVSTGDLAVQVGRSTGLLAGYLLLVQVLLVARVPVWERRIGADWLTAAHRWLGTYLTSLVAVHVVAIVAGYAAQDRVSVVRESGRIVLHYPYVLLATIGLLLLAAVMATSLAGLRRRLPYEAWHLLHLLAYAALGLALLHQLVDGAQFAAHAGARTAWIAAHVSVLVLLLRYRVVAPVALMARHRFRVSRVVAEADGSTSVYVAGHGLHRLPAVSGQFFRWRFLTRTGWYEAHPFSLSHAPNGEFLRMTAKPVGDHTRLLRTLRPGVPVLLEGPYGAMTRDLADGGPLLLVAGGSGLAPLLALAQEAAATRTPAVLVVRVSDAAQVPLRDELEALAVQRHLRVHVLAGHRGSAHHPDPLTVASLRELVPDVALRDVYLCGPPGLVRHVHHVVRRAGVPARRVHVERFDL